MSRSRLLLSSILLFSTLSITATQQTDAPRPELVLQTGQSNAWQIAFSPDGKLLAAGGMGDKTVHLWDLDTGRQLRLLEPRGSGAGFYFSGITSVAFSPDGRYIAAGSAENLVTVWEVTNGRQAYQFSGAQQGMAAAMGIRAVWFDREGKNLFTADGNGTHFRNLSAGTERSFSRDISGMIGTYAVTEATNPDGPEIISLRSSENKPRATDVVFEDLASQQATKTVTLRGEVPHGYGRFIVPTRDGRILVSTMSKEAVQVWDVTTKGEPRVLNYPNFVKSLDGVVLTMSADGNSAALSSAGKLAVWQLGRPNPQYTQQLGAASGSAWSWPVAALEYSADGRWLAVGMFDGTNGTIRILEAATGKEKQNLSGGANPANSVAFDATGHWLYAGERTRWNLESGRGEKLIDGVPAGLSTLSEDGRILAVPNGTNAKVAIWDIPSKKRITDLAPSGESVAQEVAISRDGRLAAVSYRRSQAQMERSLTATENAANARAAEFADPKQARKQAKEMMKAMAGGKNRAATLENFLDQMSASQPGDLSNQVKIWDSATGRELASLVVNPQTYFSSGAGVGGMQFSPDGKYLAIAAFGEPQLWDVTTGKQVAVLAPPRPTRSGLLGPTEQTIRSAGQTIHSMSFSPDGKQLAVAIAVHSNSLQDSLEPLLERQQEIAKQAVRSANPSVGRRLAGLAGLPVPVPKTPEAPPVPTIDQITLKQSGPIEIWDVTGARKVAVLSGHASGAERVAYSSDGKMLATSGTDSEIKLWDVATGKELHKLSGHTTRILSLAFSPDGKLLVSASSDGNTRLWDIASGEHLATLISLNQGGDWLVVTPDGLFDGSPAAWSKILWRFSANTYDVAPVEIFFNEYYYPDLLADLLSNKRPRAAVDIAGKDRRQPEIALEVSGAQGQAEITAREVTLKVRVAKAPAGARDLRLFRNGSLVRIWHGDALGAQQTADYEVKTPIVTGRNRFTAYAFNQDNVKSVDAVAEVTGASSLKRKGIAFVLAVGINQYANPEYDLRYAVADARSFQEGVKKQLEKLGRFERVELTLLTDRDATKSKILKAIGDLAERVQPEDEVLLFIASHGTAALDRFYLIPHDLGYAGKQTELDEKSVKTILSRSISDQDLEKAFEPLDAGRLLLVIDACNSGQALEAEEKRRGPMNSKGLAQLAYEKGMYVLTASQSFQAAQEVSQLGHGLLTYALVTEGLDKEAADYEPKDGRVVMREWLDYASSRVPHLQLEKMEEARKLGRSLSFGPGRRGDPSALDVSTQHPKPFYRRELEEESWIVAVFNR